MRIKLSGALIATLLVFGMVFGAGQAAAASLPGDPLYGLKLTAEQARLELTSDPEAKAEYAAELAQNRLGEIAQMVASGEEVDGEVAYKAQQQLVQALVAMHQVNGEGQLKARERLTEMVQNRHQVMASEVDASSLEQEPVRALMRSMVRVRAELQTAQGTEAEIDRQYPELSEPAGQSGAGMQAGQQDGDGLLDGSGAQTGQGDGHGVGPYYLQGEASEEEMGSFAGDEVPGPGSDLGPGPAESQEDTEAPAGPFGWLLQLFQKDTAPSGSGSSGNGSSGSGSSGNGSSGSGSSGSDSSGSSSPGASSPGTGTPGGKP